jgi:hypothetical protein
MNVRTNKRILAAGVMAVLGMVALAGCHGSPGGVYKMRYVSESDSKKVMEFTLKQPSLLGRVHMAVYKKLINGTYVVKDGETTAEGRVYQDDKGFTLVPKDDAVGQRLEMERPSGRLKDKSGATWKLDTPTTTAAALKEIGK